MAETSTSSDTGIRSETVLIPPSGDQPALLAYVASTALAGCTVLEHTDDGSVAVIRRWPNLSTGEELLWRLLVAMIDGDLAEALYRLDDRNLAALVQAVADLAQPVIARAAEARAYLEVPR